MRLNNTPNFVYYDPFTAISNQKAFQDEMKRVFAASRRRNTRFALLYLSFDYFNKDEAFLVAIENKLCSGVRKSDMVARLKENEFLIVLLDIKNPEDAAIIAHKLIQEFEKPVFLGNQSFTMTLNIGISTSPEDGEDLYRLQKNANIALYLAKEQGKNTYQYCLSTPGIKAISHVATDRNLKQALLNNEFRLHYQPKIDIKSGEVVGVEALLRWKTARGDMVSPAEFIPLAEATGDILPMTEWVLRTACRQTKMWQASGLNKLSVSVNLSTRIFTENNFLHTLEDYLRSTGLNPRHLVLEISERFLLEDIGNSIEFIKKLKQIGVKISIDNVGISNASFSYLKLFNIDYLNIDRTFINLITTDPINATIINELVTMAHGLNIKVVAEGVETKQQYEYLQKAGCDEYQGYYFSKPIPPEELIGFLEKNRNTHASATETKNTSR